MTTASSLPASLLLLCLLPTLTLTLNPTPSNSSFFQDVLDQISSGQKWDREALSVTKLDLRKAKFGSARRYEFRIRLGKRTELYFKFSGEAMAWKKVRSHGGREEGDIEEVVRTLRGMSVLDSFKMEGPFDLRVADGDQGFMLSLPNNRTHTGLRRVLVSEGITVEINRAREVHLLHTPRFNSLGIDYAAAKSGFWLHWQSLCFPLFPIRIFGSVLLVAYRTRNPNTPVETNFLSKEVIELLPEKCHNVHVYKKPMCPIDSLSLRIALFERFLRSLAGDQMQKDRLLSSAKIEVKVEAVIRLWIQIERKVTGNTTFLAETEEWRIRPTVERFWFEVVARVDKERLKPVIINKVQPFIAVDTVALSSLLSNISFTKLPSILGPETLTLDVKW